MSAPSGRAEALALASEFERLWVRRHNEGETGGEDDLAFGEFCSRNRVAIQNALLDAGIAHAERLRQHDCEAAGWACCPPPEPTPCERCSTPSEGWYIEQPFWELLPEAHRKQHLCFPCYLQLANPPRGGWALRQHTGAEAVLARVRELPERWRTQADKDRFAANPTVWGEGEGRNGCAADLDAALSAQAQPTASREPEALTRPCPTGECEYGHRARPRA